MLCKEVTTMSDARVKEKKTSQKVVRNVRDVTQKRIDHFVDFTHKVFLAGLGGFSLAQEEAERFSKRLVDRGQITEKEGRQLVKKIMTKTKKNRASIEEKIDVGIKKALPRLNLPNKSDISSIEKKIDSLAKEIDKIAKTK
jgi:poly(hydroxyalkanoate) granule-associated protein